MVEFIETSYFSRYRDRYLNDEQFRLIQSAIAGNPEIGDLMPRSGGARKMRWSDPRRGKGKRGGLRIIYYCLQPEEQVWLITLFDKNELEDLSSDQQMQMKTMIKAIKDAQSSRRQPR